MLPGYSTSREKNYSANLITMRREPLQRSHCSCDESMTLWNYLGGVHVSSAETDNMLTNMCCLASQVREPRHCITENQSNPTLLWLLVDSGQLIMQSFIVTQDTFVFKLLKECGLDHYRMWSEQTHCIHSASWAHSHLYFGLLRHNVLSVANLTDWILYYLKTHIIISR